MNNAMRPNAMHVRIVRGHEEYTDQDGMTAAENPVCCDDITLFHDSDPPLPLFAAAHPCDG